jgi:hypothetical protein
MKTVINNAAAESFEFVKRILYSFEVLVIGLFIPFLFLIGINTNYGDVSANESSISTPHKQIAPKATADISTYLSDKHS